MCFCTPTHSENVCLMNSDFSVIHLYCDATCNEWSSDYNLCILSVHSVAALLGQHLQREPFSSDCSEKKKQSSYFFQKSLENHRAVQNLIANRIESEILFLCLPFTLSSSVAYSPCTLTVIPYGKQQREDGPTAWGWIWETGQVILTGVPLHSRGNT